MKVLHIAASDLVGSRQNAFAARDYLAQDGVETRFLAWDRLSGAPDVGRLLRYPGNRRMTRMMNWVEDKLGRQSRLHWHVLMLPLHRIFRQADVVHYHDIHRGFFSIDALPLLAALKPSVWSVNDAWPMTGHCTQPVGCERWKTGCGACPLLDLPIAVRKDGTAAQFRAKKGVVKAAKMEIIVPSDEMLVMARQSPIMKSARLNKISFGVDLNVFRPQAPDAARKRLGIFPDRKVIAVRAGDDRIQGFDQFIAALDRLPGKEPITVISTHGKGRMNHYIGRHQIVELGWTNDETRLADMYAAADMMVMPANADSAGMMAIEAMASSRPVVVAAGTALGELTFAPEVGLVVPPREPAALSAAMWMLMNNEHERRERGRRGRLIAETRYDVRFYAKQLKATYRASLASRGRLPKRAP